MIELPEFMSGSLIERTYRRSRELREQSVRHGSTRAREMCLKGVRMARDRNPRMLLFLEKGADWLSHRNDEQRSRFAQEGFAPNDYTEFATWKEAYLRASEPRGREDTQLEVFGWVYGAVAEALGA